MKKQGVLSISYPAFIVYGCKNRRCPGYDPLSRTNLDTSTAIHVGDPAGSRWSPDRVVSCRDCGKPMKPDGRRVRSLLHAIRLGVVNGVWPRPEWMKPDFCVSELGHDGNPCSRCRQQWTAADEQAMNEQAKQKEREERDLYEREQKRLVEWATKVIQDAVK